MPGPLHGYRIIDLSQIVSGPMATMLLSDQGADVVKVEPVDGQDVLRRPTFSRGGLSAFFLNNNRGKRSLAGIGRNAEEIQALRADGTVA